LPPTPALRREEIRVQVALITPLVHVRGYASPETKQAAERARSLIEQAEERGEPPRKIHFSYSQSFMAFGSLTRWHSMEPSLAKSRRISWRLPRNKARRLRA
jgi:hypothetical protein